MARKTITDMQAMKHRGEPIVMLTAYDFPSARLVDDVADIILVGDTLGMVVLGYDSTLPVTVDDMIHHTKAVVRGSERALVVGDMPFMSYQTGPEDALRNAARFLQEAGATAVKLEGGARSAPVVQRLTEAGIPVMGHIGLTPQSVNQFGGYKAQGKTRQQALALLRDAKALQDAGAFAIVLEVIPAPLAKLVTERVDIPTIGIGAGPDCDGQVQVYHDLLAYATTFVPRHAKQYARIGDDILAALHRYADEVRSGAFPTPGHSVGMDDDLARELAEA
ncbi:MAG TPA: 3-methyl-2-oxobutanoate hydroxymethyltransferase [Dehalococcoidia bacterium]|nr:3-methyl-2-oxobutanoate hydroxymethyltransferase [Dehalococcoidia bacterium]